MAKTSEPKEQWYSCNKCREVGQYWVLPNGDTTFPRGELLAHNEHLTTGFSDKKSAKEWLEAELAAPLPAGM